MTTALTRRQILTAAVAAGVAVPLGSPARPASARVRLTLPAPTGPHRIGTVPLHLVDGPRRRELMAGVWYPAAGRPLRHPVVPWMTPASLRALLGDNGFDPDAAAGPRTAGHEGAAVLRGHGRLPVILFSHGAGGHRSETTIVVQELASHGYVVVTVDHTGDAYTEFPGGRLSVPDDDASFTPWDSAADMVFALDRLEDLAAGRRPLPSGLAAALDLDRVGMFGWSKGATSTALVMNEDRRVRAGLSFDGPMQSQPPVSGLRRPFMLMTAEFSRAAEPSVEEFWSQLRGWRLNVQADGALHGAYCDHQWLIPQLAEITGMSDEDLAGWIGTLDPGRAVRIQQAYPLAFFDLHLRHRRQRLLEGPSPAFPEVRYLP
ncbi:acetylhydrolase [Couchioplanes caeruleus]|uniref:alpha/beta hydrolase family protein n=1 Tax=Couchioplanes caeruleus TaxID=56438 RepID=UPI0020BEECDF|nr:acetylhydrolase [Couchioplanes caeruleus]UQU62381.1 acetylhydrolase [Couchioplanes caeruleus]